MPIYEYETKEQGSGCPRCITPFEIIQGMGDPPLSKCPDCGQSIKKIISTCRAAVIETDDENGRVEKRIKEYEKNNMWSHAAELADKHSAETSNQAMRSRALDNYKKAGYNPSSIEKHSNVDD